jgi:hypothetical protein
MATVMSWDITVVVQIRGTDSWYRVTCFYVSIISVKSINHNHLMQSS